jgi:hypothetical protein
LRHFANRKTTSEKKKDNSVWLIRQFFEVLETPLFNGLCNFLQYDRQADIATMPLQLITLTTVIAFHRFIKVV